MDSESSTKFIGSLTKFLQSLCNGYVEFDDGVELIGHIYLSVDAGKTGKTLNYFLNEKVCKNDNSVTFISNSFHAQPEGKSKPSGKDESRKEDGDVSDSGDNVPKSTNAGTVLSRPHASSRLGSSPNQNRTGVHIGTKRPGSPLKGPAPQRRAPSPPSRRLQSSVPRGTVGSPVSKTVPSSPSSSSQDNIPSPSPARRNRNDIGQPTSNQSDNHNVGADSENDIVSSNVLSINPTPEFASFLGSLTSDNQTSQDQSSPPDTKPDTDVTFIKEEFVSEPSSCAQAGSGGQHSGRSGEDNSGLYPVMLHQNTSVFPSTSTGFPSYQGGASSTATSQQPGFPGSSSSQSDPFNPVPGTSQDGADPSVSDCERWEEEDMKTCHSKLTARAVHTHEKEASSLQYSFGHPCSSGEYSATEAVGELSSADAITKKSYFDDFTSIQRMSAEGISISNSASSLTCDQCQKTFTRAWSLGRHQATCSAVCLIPCDLCDQSFSRMDNLKVHVRRVHGLGPSLQCPKCLTRFRSKIGLNKHLLVCRPR